MVGGGGVCKTGWLIVRQIGGRMSYVVLRGCVMVRDALRKRSVTARLPVELVEWAEGEAVRLGVSLSWVLMLALQGLRRSGRVSGDKGVEGGGLSPGLGRVASPSAGVVSRVRHPSVLPASVPEAPEVLPLDRVEVVPRFRPGVERKGERGRRG